MKRHLIIFLGLFALLFTQCKSLKNKTETSGSVTTEEVKEKTTAKPDKDYIPVDKDVRIGKLPNGMTYYIRRNKKPEKKVEMRLAVNAGSVLEDEDQLGLAHFMEHMNFNGTKNFQKNELIDFLQKLGVRFGADLNAFTSFDETIYILPIPLDDSTNLDKGLLVLHDWAYFATLDSTEIEKERGVVLEEYRLGLGAEKRMMNKWIPIAFKDSRYAERLPIGKKEILENFPHESLKRFHKDWYRPDLEAIIIVGDIDPDQVEKKLKKMFADIPKKENPRERKSFDVPNHKETLIATAQDPEAAYNQVIIMYKDHEPYKPDVTVEDYKEYLKEKLFTKILNNRLEDLKEQADPPFSMASAYHGGWVRSKQSFNLFAITGADKREKALETLLTEAKKAKELGFTQSELERAKKELMQSIEEAYNNRHTTESSNYTWEYISHYLEGEPIPSVQWEYDMHKLFLPQFKLEEVNALAKKFIHDDNRVIVITGKEAEDIKPVSENDVKSVISKVDALKLDYAKKDEAELVLMKEKPAPGKIIKTETDDVLQTKTYYLSNGAKVMTKKTDFKEDQILFMGFKFGGESLLDNETLKKTKFAFPGVTEAGVNGLKKSDLRKILSGKKAKVNLSIDNTTQMSNGKTLQKDLETAMQLNYLYYTALNKDPKAFESWKKRTAAFMGNLLNNPQFKFSKAFSDFLNKDNPRYIGAFPTPDMLATQDYDLAYDKFRQFYDGATDFNYYIVGNFDENKMENFVKTYIGGLPKSALPGEYKKYEDKIIKGKHEFIYHAGKDPKSMVVILMRGKTPYNPVDRLKFSILGKILNNILIDVLREEASDVYTVRAMGTMKKIPHESYMFQIFFPCGPENTRKLADMAMNELHKIMENGPTEEDLKKVTKSLIIKFDEDIKTNEFWVDYLSDIDYLGADPHRFQKFKDMVNSIKPEDIKEIANRLLSKPETNILAILYPEGYEENK